jgi:hypothetical protein
VQLIIILLIAFKLIFGNLGFIIQVIGALGIDAFMDDEVLAIFLRNQGMGTVRALKSMLLGKAVFLRAEGSTADFAKDLPFRAVILVEIRHRSITVRAGTFFGNITFGASFNRHNHFTVTEFVVFLKPLVFNSFVTDYFRKDICFEFLVLWRMAVVKSPLLKRNIFSDKK